MSKNTFAKFRRMMDKYDDATFATGFSKSELWTSTGNYALNYLLSGDFFRGYLFGRSVVISGISGSGKSVMMATGCAEAQKAHKARILWIDSENASDRKEFFTRCGLNIDEFQNIEKTKKKKKSADEEDSEPGYAGENFMYLQVGKISRTKRLIADIVSILNDELKDVDDPMNPEQYRPLVIAIDSYSNLMTDAEADHMESGEAKGDQGQHAKQTKALIKAITHQIKRRPILILGATHSMASNDPYAPDEKMLGGRGIEYMASLAFMFSKLKLKEADLDDSSLIGTIEDEYADEEEDTSSDKTKKKASKGRVIGIKCKATVYKNRFSKPNEAIEVQLVYPHGLSAYSGLFDFLLNDGQITKAGGKAGSYKLTRSVAGIPDTFTKKTFLVHADNIMKALNGSLTVEAPTENVAVPGEDPEQELMGA